nr:reverse transcriptase domain-containing protein [Tanacetum cinerariifolium]
MRTRSRSRHKIAEPLCIEFPSQEDQFLEDPPEVPMADNRTMTQLLQAPTVGACPHHGFSELHQLDTFYNALNVNDQDALNSAAVVAKVNSSSSTPVISSDVAELKDMVRALLLDKKNQSSAPAPSPTPAPVKVNQPPAYQAPAYQAPIPQTQSVSQTDFERYVKANDVVLRNIQSQGQSTQNQCQNIQNQYQTMQNQLANLTDMMSKFMSSNIASSSGSGTLPEPVVAPVSVPMPNLKPSIPYPSRRDNERRRDQANEQIEKSYEIFKNMSFEISFTDALILMPKFASTLKALIGNKEKLSEMARTPMNEHCAAVILNKLPKKLGDPGCNTLKLGRSGILGPGRVTSWINNTRYILNDKKSFETDTLELIKIFDTKPKL